MTNHHTILLPVLVLACWTSLWLWGLSLAELLLMLLIGIPLSRIACWTRTRVTVFGAHKDGTWMTRDGSGLMHAPIVFYVFGLALATMHRENSFDYLVAWVYVCLRIACSLSDVPPIARPKKQLLFLLSTAALQLLSGHILFEMSVT